MARSQTFDYLHNMRFHVKAGSTDIQGLISAQHSDQVKEAGFSAVTVPEPNMEAVEYREGQYLFTRKFPGHVTYNNITMSRGVTRRDTGFYSWMDRTIMGTEEYRTELTIFHYHRKDTLPGHANKSAPPDTNINIDSATPRKYVVYEAFPVRHKFASDLDATDSAVSIMELEVAYEYVTLDDPTSDLL